MSIYTANVLNARTIQSPDFIQREIHGLNTGRLEDIHTVGIPDEMQPHYPQYVGNISAFLHATATQRKVVCGRSYLPRINPGALIPLPLPPLQISPLRPFQHEEDEQAYKSRISMEHIDTVYLKRKSFIIPSISASQLSTLPPTDPNVPTPTNAVSLTGLKSYLTSVKILTLFLATHSYAAFQTPDDFGTDTSDDMDLHQLKQIPRLKVARGRSENYTTSAGRKAWTKGDPSMAEELHDYPNDEHTWSMQGTVSVAKPAPLYPNINYGAPSKIPNLPGHLFPYFQGLIFPAEHSLITITRRFFLACFGENPEAIHSEWSKWAKSVSKWHRTAAGQALAHIFFVLQTALECQGRLFVVISQGVYLGSAIIGYKFKVSHRGQLIDAHTAAELKSRASSLDDHNRALVAIVSTLKALKLKGEDDLRMDLEIDTSTPRSIHKEFLKRESVDEEELDALKGLFEKLAFAQRFWSISGESIEKMLTSIISVDDPIPDEWPMYLDPLSIYDDSRIYDVMSAFGPTAPSFTDANGQIVKIPAGREAADPESEVPPEGKTVRRPFLFVTSKPLFVACNDMRGVFNKRSIRQNVSERAGGYRTIRLAGKQRDIVWTALKMIPVVGKVDKGKNKRLSDEFEDSDQPVVKKSKVVEEVLANDDF